MGVSSVAGRYLRFHSHTVGDLGISTFYYTFLCHTGSLGGDWCISRALVSWVPPLTSLSAWWASVAGATRSLSHSPAFHLHHSAHHILDAWKNSLGFIHWGGVHLSHWVSHFHLPPAISGFTFSPSRAYCCPRHSPPSLGMGHLSASPYSFSAWEVGMVVSLHRKDWVFLWTILSGVVSLSHTMGGPWCDIHILLSFPSLGAFLGLTSACIQGLTILFPHFLLGLGGGASAGKRFAPPALHLWGCHKILISSAW